MESPMNKLRVLIVEDNWLIADLLAEMIEAIGHEVCGIETGERGSVASARRLRPDLMIVDAQLQEGSGIGAVDAIEREFRIPHIFVSGDVSKVRRLKPEATLLQKPYFEFDLLVAIKSALAAEAS
jgi:CheY-like chemotaxis protein